jgi:NAD(P)-dependent dehydrogenase (short-subunit alcohol dehydrogenase family)
MNINPFSLEGKTILITGASSGIGRQCSISCSEMGATVILIGRNEDRLKETLQLMTEPEKHLLYRVDLTEFELIETAINEIVGKVGKIDGVVNSAGISTTLPVRMVTPKKMEEFFQPNVYGAINLTRLVTRKAFFSEKGGSIIFISSVMGIVGEVAKSLYSMTKGALISGSRSLALEFADRKIRVNCTSPGVVMTPMAQNAIYNRDEDSLNKVAALHPLGLGSPEDVANTCIFLLSDASKWITGTNVVVDGGYTAR